MLLLPCVFVRQLVLREFQASSVCSAVMKTMWIQSACFSNRRAFLVTELRRCSARFGSPCRSFGELADNVTNVHSNPTSRNRDDPNNNREDSIDRGQCVALSQALTRFGAAKDELTLDNLVKFCSTMRPLLLCPPLGDSRQVLIPQMLFVLSKRIGQTSAERRADLLRHIQLESDFLSLWYDAAISRLSLFDTQGLSNSLYAHVFLTIPPRPDFYELWHTTALPRLHEFKHSEFTNCFYAHARLKLELPAAFLDRWYAIASQNMLAFSAWNLSTILYGHAKLQLQPPSDCLDLWYKAAFAQFPNFSPQALVNIMQAHAILYLTVPNQFLDVWFQAAFNLLQECKPQELSLLLHALCSLKLRPPNEFMAKWFAVAQSQLCNFGPQDFSLSIYALGEFHLVPNKHFLSEWHFFAARLLPKFPPQALSNVLYAHAQLKLLPPAAFLQGWYASAGACLDEFLPQNISDCFHSHATLRLQPAAEFLSRLFAVSERRLKEFDSQALSNILHGIARLRLNAPESLLRQFNAAIEQKLDANDFGGVNLALAMYALALLHATDSFVSRTLVERFFAIVSKSSGTVGMATEELHAVYLAMQYFDRKIPFSLGVLLIALKCKLKSQTADMPSEFHLSCFDAMRRLNCVTNLRCEVWCDVTASKVDIGAKLLDGRQLFVQVDGPEHLLLPSGIEKAEHFVQAKLLRKAGVLVRVPLAHWLKLNGDRTAQTEYLKSAIDDAVKASVKDLAELVAQDRIELVMARLSEHFEDRQDRCTAMQNVIAQLVSTNNLTALCCLQKYVRRRRLYVPAFYVNQQITRVQLRQTPLFQELVELIVEDEVVKAVEKIERNYSVPEDRRSAMLELIAHFVASKNQNALRNIELAASRRKCYVDSRFLKDQISIVFQAMYHH